MGKKRLNKAKTSAEKVRELRISGSLTGPRSAELKDKIRNSLKKEGQLQLVVRDEDVVDLTFLQIISAAMKTAKKDNIKVKIQLPVPDVLSQSIIDAGLQNHGVCRADYCLWCEVINQGSGSLDNG